MSHCILESTFSVNFKNIQDVIQNTRMTNLAVKFCMFIAASKYLQSQTDPLPPWVAKITFNSPSSYTVISTEAHGGIEYGGRPVRMC